MGISKIFILLFAFICAFIFSGFLYVWVTMGRGAFWRGLSKSSLFDVIQQFIEAKQNNSEEYREVLKRTIIYFAILIVFVVFGVMIVIS